MSEFAWVGWVIGAVLVLLGALGGFKYFTGKVDATVRSLEANDVRLSGELSTAITAITNEVRELKKMDSRITQIEALVAVGRLAEKLDVLARLEGKVDGFMRELTQQARLLERHLRDDRTSHDALSDRVNELSNEVQILLLEANRNDRAEALRRHEQRAREAMERTRARGGSSSDDLERDFPTT